MVPPCARASPGFDSDSAIASGPLFLLWVACPEYAEQMPRRQGSWCLHRARGVLKPGAEPVGAAVDPATDVAQDAVHSIEHFKGESYGPRCADVA